MVFNFYLHLYHFHYFHLKSNQYNETLNIRIQKQNTQTTLHL